MISLGSGKIERKKESPLRDAPVRPSVRSPVRQFNRQTRTHIVVPRGYLFGIFVRDGILSVADYNSTLMGVVVVSDFTMG